MLFLIVNITEETITIICVAKQIEKKYIPTLIFYKQVMNF